MPLFLIFILVPIIEIALFIQVGGAIGLWPTIGLVLLSAIVGTALIRSQGARAMLEIQESFRTLSDPTRPLAHGAMILFAGVLLLTPGFFTDTIGLLLLIPGVRDWVMRRAGRHVNVTRSGFGFDSARDARHGWPGRDDDVIDGEYVVQDDVYAARDDIGLAADKRDEAASRNRNKPSGWTRPH